MAAVTFSKGANSAADRVIVCVASLFGRTGLVLQDRDLRSQAGFGCHYGPVVQNPLLLQPSVIPEAGEIGSQSHGQNHDDHYRHDKRATLFTPGGFARD